MAEPRLSYDEMMNRLNEQAFTGSGGVYTDYQEYMRSLYAPQLENLPERYQGYLDRKSPGTMPEYMEQAAKYAGWVKVGDNAWVIPGQTFDDRKTPLIVNAVKDPTPSRTSGDYYFRGYDMPHGKDMQAYVGVNVSETGTRAHPETSIEFDPTLPMEIDGGKAGAGILSNEGMFNPSSLMVAGVFTAGALYAAGAAGGAGAAGSGTSTTMGGDVASLAAAETAAGVNPTATGLTVGTGATSGGSMAAGTGLTGGVSGDLASIGAEIAGIEAGAAPGYAAVASGASSVPGLADTLASYGILPGAVGAGSANLGQMIMDGVLQDNPATDTGLQDLIDQITGGEEDDQTTPPAGGDTGGYPYPVGSTIGGILGLGLMTGFEERAWNQIKEAVQTGREGLKQTQEDIDELLTTARSSWDEFRDFGLRGIDTYESELARQITPQDIMDFADPMISEIGRRTFNQMNPGLRSSGAAATAVGERVYAGAYLPTASYLEGVRTNNLSGALNQIGVGTGATAQQSALDTSLSGFKAATGQGLAGLAAAEGQAGAQFYTSLGNNIAQLAQNIGAGYDATQQQNYWMENLPNILNLLQG